MIIINDNINNDYVDVDDDNNNNKNQQQTKGFVLCCAKVLGIQKHHVER